LDFSLRGNFLTCSLSPVMLLSSVWNSSPSISKQSAGIWSPYFNSKMSPTKRSYADIDLV
jgi:hypothetical protein